MATNSYKSTPLMKTASTAMQFVVKKEASSPMRWVGVAHLSECKKTVTYSDSATKINGYKEG